MKLTTLFYKLTELAKYSNSRISITTYLNSEFGEMLSFSIYDFNLDISESTNFYMSTDTKSEIESKLKGVFENISKFNKNGK